MASADDVLAIAKEIESLERRLEGLRQRVEHDAESRFETGEGNLLVCHLGDEQIAVPLQSVRTVVLACRLTAIAGAPCWVSGMLNLNGVGIPVIDLLARAAGQARRMALGDLIVICEAGSRSIGLVVQNAQQVDGESVASLRSSLLNVPHASYVSGIVQLAGRSVMLLSVKRLLTALGAEGAAA